MELRRSNLVILDVCNGEIRLDGPNGPTFGEMISRRLGLQEGRVKARYSLEIDLLPVEESGGMED